MIHPFPLAMARESDSEEEKENFHFLCPCIQALDAPAVAKLWPFQYYFSLPYIIFRAFLHYILHKYTVNLLLDFLKMSCMFLWLFFYGDVKYVSWNILIHLFWLYCNKEQNEKD
jgi:hypothetical protein